VSDNKAGRRRKHPQLLTVSAFHGIVPSSVPGVDAATASSPTSARTDGLPDDAWLLLLDQLCELSEHDFDGLVVAARAARRFEEGNRGRR